MGTNPDDGKTSDEEVSQRRNVLKTVGGLIVVGTVGTGSASAKGGPKGRGGGPPSDDKRGPPDDKGGPPNDDHHDDERTITWNGRRGSEYATQDCHGAVGYWHWILTPGGSTEYTSVGELEVTFKDGSKQTVQGVQKGNGAYHFHVRKAGGGTVTDASVQVVGGGRNALLTISDGECEEADVLYWQVDFGEGEVKDPPKYWPDDLMAALGNSKDGVTDNPSLRRQQTVGQLKDVEIHGNEFTFDDAGNPSTVTVEFTIKEGGRSRDLHLSSWILPGEYDGKEVEQQEKFEADKKEFNGGNHGTLTIDLPQLE